MWKILGILGSALALMGGYLLIASGFDTMRAFRQLERVPQVDISAALPGEVNLRGRAQSAGDYVTAPDTNKQTLYYRYHVEREERDSDGGTRWVTVRDERRFTDFYLSDGTGQVLVQPGGAEINAQSSHSRRQGSYRYTEYRIDEGDTAFLFGYASLLGGEVSVRFDRQGHYTGLISEFGEFSEREDMATFSVLKTMGGLALLALGCLLVCLGFGIHQTAMFLFLNMGLLSGTLLVLGFSTAATDIRDAHDHLREKRQAATDVVHQILAEEGMQWRGDWDELKPPRPLYQYVSGQAQQRIDAIRAQMYQIEQRTRHFRQKWPAAWFAWMNDLSADGGVSLTEPETAGLQLNEANYRYARIPQWLAWIFQGVGLVLALGLAWYGYRHVKVKRLIENMPTVKTRGATYGVVELSGRIEPVEDTPLLNGPVSGKDCVQYFYKVEEKRGSGKNSKWVTIEKRDEHLPFYIEDSAGRMLVDAEGAEIITTHKSKRRDGRLRYTERRLQPRDKLYALGSAGIQGEHSDSLALGAGPKGIPYILSNKSEQDVMLGKSRAGFTALTFGMLGGVLGLLGLAAGMGAFGALPFLFAALVPGVYLSLILLVLIYNDLVFLRQRIRSTWSNIEISLRKRVNLIPRLEHVTKAYLNHEKSVQTLIARLRSETDQGEYSRADGAAIVATEQKLHKRLFALIEQYPDLKGNEVVQSLMNSMTDMENEIALMRSGHNDAVERYNTRREQLPEIFLAKAFKFETAQAMGR